jgi:glycosyltransferase involved in cell wall biosynthesis
MRIAYIAPYQGPGLLKSRPIVRNLTLAANVKMELVAELLRRNGHNVEVLSHGAVIEPKAMLYRAFREPDPFDREIPVFYAPALPVRRLNGLSSAIWTLRLFQRRQKMTPFDAVMIYNLQFPQALCAWYAINWLRLPVILEYEDDALVDVLGQQQRGWSGGAHLRLAKWILRSVSGCVGVSPHLLGQVRGDLPNFLLRGVVGEDILKAGTNADAERKNWVVFSGTHFRTKGLEPLVEAWELLKAPGWELHIAGHGEKTDLLKKVTRHDKTIVFHGLLNREENAKLLGMAKVGMNPHDLSAVPGNVFAFKIVEYLAAGNHVITTPMGALEKDLEAGITYIPDNSPPTIAAALRKVLDGRLYERTAPAAAQRAYGPAAVAKSLNGLLEQVADRRLRESAPVAVAARS